MRRGIDIIKEAAVNSDGMLEWNDEILTSEILQSEINIAMIRRGGFSDSTIAACGSQAAEPHNTGSGPIFTDKTIIIDIFPRIRKTGYWGDITRTVVKGKAPAIVKKAYKAVFEAREYAKTLIKPGAIPAEIHNAAKELMEKQGFATGRKNERNFGFFHGLGHSLGLEIHENPSLNPRSSGQTKITDLTFPKNVTMTTGAIIMPIRKPKSPTRFVMKALIPASDANFLSK